MNRLRRKRLKKKISLKALLSKQEKEMNSVVGESRKLQKEGEENLKVEGCNLYILHFFSLLFSCSIRYVALHSTDYHYLLSLIKYFMDNG
jgi:hypothetical protein